MHQIDERITKEYLKTINFSFEAAVEALAPVKRVSKSGLEEFARWRDTNEGVGFWEKEWRKGLSDEGRVIISDMILVSMGLTPEEAAVYFASEETTH